MLNDELTRPAAIAVSRVDHTAVMVADLDATVAWYVDAVGAVVTDRWADADAAMAWAHIEIAGTRIEFVQRDGLSPAGDALVGLHHIALVVVDCAAATRALVAAGAESIVAPSYFARHDMDWSFVRDPFGTILELVAYRAANLAPARP